jgi:hypothetical protein
MGQPTIEIEGLSIVLLGSFNPQIFQPAWFAAEDLIRKEEAEAAKIEIIHPEIVSFAMEWLRLQVTQERFAVSTANSPSYEPLRDLVLGTFQLLQHTPVRQMGLNRDLHFRMASEEAWHAFGHRLAPKEPWTGLLDQPGLRRLVIQGARPDDFTGYIQVSVEPSRRVHPGVYVGINDHYEVQHTASSQGCDHMMDILSRVWATSVARSTNLANTLVGLK